MDKPRDYYAKLSEPDKQRQMSYDIAYKQNLIFKNGVNELIYKTEIDLLRWKTNLGLPKGMWKEG